LATEKQNQDQETNFFKKTVQAGGRTLKRRIADEKSTGECSERGRLLAIVGAHKGVVAKSVPKRTLREMLPRLRAGSVSIRTERLVPS
jgi:hypothetical protein